VDERQGMSQNADGLIDPSWTMKRQSPIVNPWIAHLRSGNRQSAICIVCYYAGTSG
jgi:hypothetical protein